ncbi:MAG: hypothetical protein U0412_02305 [Nitrospira sp.]
MNRRMLSVVVKERLQALTLTCAHGLDSNTEAMAAYPGDARLHDEERVFLVREVQEQCQIHAGCDGVVSPYAESVRRQVDYSAVSHDDVGVCHTRIHQAEGNGRTGDYSLFCRGGGS